MIATDLKQIKDYWRTRATEVAEDAEVTHSDVWQRWLEIERIKELLRPSDRVIDVGCGNGYTARLIAPWAQEVVGVDYTQAMVDRARASVSSARGVGNIRFEVGDVLELTPEKLGLFDVAISGRCLINLGSWESQKRAIENIAGVLREDGRFLFIEGSRDGRVRLNQFRESVGLAPMPPVWYNLDFDEAELFAFLKDHFVVERQLRFGVYDLIARVAHPLLVAPEAPDYKAPINQVAAQLALNSQACGEISRVLFLVLRKKS